MKKEKNDSSNLLYSIKKLPQGWSSAKISTLVHLVNGRAFKPSEWETSGLPIVRIQNLNNPEAPFNFSTKKFDEKFLIASGTLVFAWSGTPGTFFGAHIWKGGNAWLNQHIFKVVFDESLINKKYLRFAINQNLNEYIHNAHGGAGLAHITKGKFDSSEILLPPLAEQHRIVAKIEELFSDLDAGIASLKQVQAQLKTYRQAVLKYAFEGKLTAAWRAQHKPEPAEKLLAQIKAEREKQYEQQLAEWQKATVDNKGKKKSLKPQKPKEFPPLTKAELAELPKLPEWWCWVRAGQIADDIFDGPFGSNLKTADYTENGIRVIRLENIGYLQFNDEKKSFISREKYRTLEKHTVFEGDILFSSFISDCIKTTILPRLEDITIAKAD